MNKKLLILLVILSTCYSYNMRPSILQLRSSITNNKLSYNDIIKHNDNKQISQFIINDNTNIINIKLKNDTNIYTYIHERKIDTIGFLDVITYYYHK